MRRAQPPAIEPPSIGHAPLRCLAELGVCAWRRQRSYTAKGGAVDLRSVPILYCFVSMSNEPLPILALALNARLLRRAKIITTVIRTMPAKITMKRAVMAFTISPTSSCPEEVSPAVSPPKTCEPDASRAVASRPKGSRAEYSPTG